MIDNIIDQIQKFNYFKQQIAEQLECDYSDYYLEEDTEYCINRTKKDFYNLKGYRADVRKVDQRFQKYITPALTLRVNKYDYEIFKFTRVDEYIIFEFVQGYDDADFVYILKADNAVFEEEIND